MGCSSSTEAGGAAIAAATTTGSSSTAAKGIDGQDGNKNSTASRCINDPTLKNKRKTIIKSSHQLDATETTDAVSSSYHDGGSSFESATMSATNNNPSTTNESPTSTPTTSGSNGCQEGVVIVNKNVTLRYACLTHKGFDPDDNTKPNQDSYSVHETLHVVTSSAGRSSNDNRGSNPSFFGVYDGHGPDGHKCSQYVERKLPSLIKDYVMNNTQAIKKQQASVSVVDIVEASLQDAHTTCNTNLRKTSNINDLYSGTTAVSIYVHGHEEQAEKQQPPAQPQPSRITVSNVGDSRAIIGTQLTNLQVKAVPLTKDQTPYRQDEAQRCIDSGARILSFGQIDPNSGHDDDDDDDIEDPPRVWSTKGNYPGTAFTRSIGDAIAQQLGVFAEPEVMTLNLTTSEKFIVLASDGVFDILDNQQVVDICCNSSSSRNSDKQEGKGGGGGGNDNGNIDMKKTKCNPSIACQEIIKQSHQGWIVQEIENDNKDEATASYDDMTVICIFIDHHDDGQDGNRAEENAAAAVVAPTSSPEEEIRRGGGEQEADGNKQQASESSSSTETATRKTKRVRQKTLRNLGEAIHEEELSRDLSIED